MKKDSIQFYTIDHTAGGKGFVSKPHSHKHYEIFYFERGNGSHFIDFEELEIKDNSFFLVSYNQVHYITAKPKAYNLGYVISIDRELVSLLDSEIFDLFGKFSQSPAFYLKRRGLFTTLFNEIKSELESGKPKSIDIAYSYIRILLWYVWREQNRHLPSWSSKSDLYLEFTRLLEQNFMRVKSVNEYATMLSVTTKRLNKACKDSSKVSALAIIHQRINLEAKRKLFYSHNQVKDVCYELGFEDPGHFNNFFKRMNHITPVQFRSRMSQIFN